VWGQYYRVKKADANGRSAYLEMEKSDAFRRPISYPFPIVPQHSWLCTRRFGFATVGRAPSRSIPGRTLPRMESRITEGYRMGLDVRSVQNLSVTRSGGRPALRSITPFCTSWRSAPRPPRCGTQ
jgi:hypothetical protein